MSDFCPSEFQKAIFTWFANAQPGQNLIVDAVAGSGKTSTIERAARLIPSSDSVLFLAFNKHIADELRSRLPEHVQASTLNSFGWQVCRTNVKGVKLEQYKTYNIIDSCIADPEKRREWKSPIKQLIGLKKACPSLSAEEILKRFDIEAPLDPEFLVAAGDVWKQSVKMTGLMDFDDQIFMAMIKKFPLPKYDWVLVDEAQDLSEVQIDMVRQIGKRIICVGDPYQAIYAFRGAAPDSMDRIKAALNPTILPLSICYRCPKEVVKEAQKIVPHIQYAETANDGTVETIETKDFIDNAESGDWALCRTTAPLVKRCMQFIVAGKKAMVKGRDIGQNIVSLIDKINQLGDLCPMTQFGPMLQEYYAMESARLEAAQREGQLETLEDKVNCIEALSEGSKTVHDVKQKIVKIFSDTNSIGITFATAHRSKGLEANQIYLLRPDLMPFPKAKTPWQKQQELNLQYVATTRSKDTFSYVLAEPGELKRKSK